MKNIVLISCVVLLFVSCKKDILKGADKKTYAGANAPGSNPEYNSGWSLTLYKDGKADILPSGDIVYQGSYKVSGSTITVKAINESFKFKILSENEIQNQYGNILKLQP